MSRLAGLASGVRGFDELAAKADLEPTLAALDEAETRRAVAFERVVLLGEDGTTQAGHQLNQALRGMEWIARGLVKGSLDKWKDAREKYVAALIEFHKMARERLRVSGEITPRYEVAHPDGGQSSQLPPTPR